MFARDIDSDASRRGVLLGIDIEGDVPGLRDGYLNVAVRLSRLFSVTARALSRPRRGDFYLPFDYVGETMLRSCHKELVRVCGTPTTC